MALRLCRFLPRPVAAENVPGSGKRYERPGRLASVGIRCRCCLQGARHPRGQAPAPFDVPRAVRGTVGLDEGAGPPNSGPRRRCWTDQQRVLRVVAPSRSPPIALRFPSASRSDSASRDDRNASGGGYRPATGRYYSRSVSRVVPSPASRFLSHGRAFPIAEDSYRRPYLGSRFPRSQYGHAKTSRRTSAGRVVRGDRESSVSFVHPTEQTAEPANRRRKVEWSVGEPR